MHYSSVPEWLQVPFIKTGYIYPGLTHQECLWLLFTWHNQTLNAWTMILGAFVSTCLYIHSDLSIAFTVLWLSAIFHMPFAVANHLFRHISREHYVYYKNLDMYLILICSVMLTFSLSIHVFSPVYTSINTGLALVTACIAAKTKHEIGKHTDKLRHVGMFILNVLSYLAPVMIYYNHWTSIGILTCATSALLVYTTGFPEKYFESSFDIIGASHQLMHLFVLFAHIFEYKLIKHVKQDTHTPQPQDSTCASCWPWPSAAAFSQQEGVPEP